MTACRREGGVASFTFTRPSGRDGIPKVSTPGACHLLAAMLPCPCIGCLPPRPKHKKQQPKGQLRSNPPAAFICFGCHTPLSHFASSCPPHLHLHQVVLRSLGPGEGDGVSHAGIDVGKAPAVNPVQRDGCEGGEVDGSWISAGKEICGGGGRGLHAAAAAAEGHIWLAVRICRATGRCQLVAMQQLIVHRRLARVSAPCPTPPSFLDPPSLLLA